MVVVDRRALTGFVFSFIGLQLLGLGGLLLWAFWPTIVELLRRWSSDPQYSHGYFIPVFALAILWLRRGKLAGARPGISAWGVGVLLLAGGLRFLAAYLYVDWLDSFALLACLAGVALFLGGVKALAWSWPAIAFLVFMIPLPYRLELFMSAPLRGLATDGSTYVLQTLGFPAFSEGNVIFLDETRLGVEEACSGLSMLMVFFALSVAATFFLQRPLWEKLLLVVSAVPIAIVANVARIVVTGILHETAGHELADLVFHDLAGLIMMPIALGLLILELKFLGRLMVTPRETPPIRAQRGGVKASLLPALSGPAPAKKGSPPVASRELMKPGAL
jgi:exosortase